MCGLAGIIGKIDEEKNNQIIKMISSLYHRGPDKIRVLKAEKSLLAFSRLKIIDFKDRSMQPMVSNNKKHILLFNGEIYNFKDLRKSISKKYHFNTKSDTEVLLAMLALYGIKCLPEIYGMFSFCHYDVEKDIYTLARDRYGQKPMFYHQGLNTFYFASEIKSLLVAGIKNIPDLTSVYEYLDSGKIDCSKNTWFKEIKQLEAGQYLQIQRSVIKNITKWYNLKNINKIIIPKKISDRNDFINDIFIKVSEEHLNSDTKIGVKLSGGLDSSTLLASMEKNKKYLSNQCFTVDFGSSFSEKEWVIETAKFFHKDAIISSYTINDFINDFDNMIFTHEGPLGGLMNCAFEKIYQNANDSNIRVLLDGTGLDEAFGGYRVHHLFYLNNLYNKKDKNFLKYVNDYSKKWKIKITDIVLELKRLNNILNFVQDGSSFSQKKYTTEYIQSFGVKNMHKADKHTNIHSHFINYIEHSKIPKNTRMKDRQSMSYSVELRMPFLDHRIIELGLSLDDINYFQGGLTKSIIREVMKDKLPEKVRLDQKRSIQAPQSQWLREPKIKEFIIDVISSTNFKNRGVFNTVNVNKAYEYFLKNGACNTFHIWQWINVEKFFNTFIDKKITVNEINNIEFLKLSA